MQYCEQVFSKTNVPAPEFCTVARSRATLQNTNGEGHVLGESSAHSIEIEEGGGRRNGKTYHKKTIKNLLPVLKGRGKRKKS